MLSFSVCDLWSLSGYTGTHGVYEASQMLEEAHKIKILEYIQGTAMFVWSNTAAVTELYVLYQNILYTSAYILYILFF